MATRYRYTNSSDNESKPCQDPHVDLPDKVENDCAAGFLDPGGSDGTRNLHKGTEQFSREHKEGIEEEMRYLVLTAGVVRLQEVVDLVNQYIQSGWTPLGGIAIGASSKEHWCQAMVKNISKAI